MVLVAGGNGDGTGRTLLAGCRGTACDRADVGRSGSVDASNESEAGE